MKNVLLIFAFLNVSITFAQVENDYVLYLDSMGDLVSQEKYHFTRVLKNYYGEQLPCVVIEFYKSGQRKLIGTLSDKYKMLKTGPFNSYYENGKLEGQISYENDQPKGKSYFWYENGNKKAECEFIWVGKKKEPLMKVNQYWSRIAIQRVVDGKGRFQDEDNTSSSEGALENGFKEGEWWGTDYKDSFTFTENFKKGTLSSGISVDSLGIKHSYKSIYTPPRPLKSIDDFYNHFDKKMREIHGYKSYTYYSTILVGLRIEIDGSVKNITVLHDISSELKRKIITSISTYGKWLPATSRGIISEVSMMIPIYVQLY